MKHISSFKSIWITDDSSFEYIVKMRMESYFTRLAFVKADNTISEDSIIWLSVLSCLESVLLKDRIVWITHEK